MARLIGAVFFCLFCLLVKPAGAFCDVSLGFLESYTVNGDTSIHHGVDVSMAAGDVVYSPVSGQVVFSGRVPGPRGGSVTAVTIETSRGAVTLLPLTDALGAPAQVSIGAPVGSCAAEGDPSSTVSHVHLSLRQNGEYADPIALACLVGGSPLTKPAPAPAIEHQAPVKAPQQPVPVSADARVTSPVEAIETVNRVDRQSAPTQSLAVQASPAPDTIPIATLPLAMAPVAASPQQSIQAPHRGAQTRHARGGGLIPQPPRGAIVAWSLACGGLAGGGLLLCRFNRRVASGRVSDRLGTLLQHLKAGDTLCGLTSCSGPTAFTVPGPLAQRR